jgi:LysM repeat protein
MKIHFLLAALFLPSLALAQQSVKLSVAQYIERYQRIAVSEMERSGIPASIKLAQGIHESAYGNSGLAQEANNHFGIKCGSDWKGQTYSKWDDEAQESCFRVYGSGEESYIEHTAFLVNRKRYAFLFEYDRTDYKNWARGLRKAGYASDPKYPDKLIETIEKYNLHRFDTLSGTIAFDQPQIIRPTPTPAPPPPPRLDSTAIFVRPNRSPRRVKRRSFLFPQYKKGIFRQNEASYVVAQKGESALGVATRFGIPYAKLLKFNDLEDGDVLMDYQYVYIQPKKGQYKGEPSTHTVSQDETMYELAQFYGLRLETLLELNLLQVGQEPMNGSVIQLVEKASSPPSLRPRNYTYLMPE